VFGPANYREGFVSTVLGFGIAVLAGGLSSAASFSAETAPNASTTSSSNSSQIQNANSWFFSMAGCCGLGLILLHVIERYPYDYTKLPPGYKKPPHKPESTEENEKFESNTRVTSGKEEEEEEPAPNRQQMMRKAT